MNLKRRAFIGQVSVAAAAVAAAGPLSAVASVTQPANGYDHASGSVTIFHTNDLHGNLGQITGSTGLKPIKSFLRQQKNTALLFDGGNFLDPSASDRQNLATIALMNTMGYRAATIGKNELAAGQQTLARLVSAINFSLVNCNYALKPELAGKIFPYITFRSGNLKVGVTGVGPRLRGVGFNDPVSCANTIAATLKNREKCDLVICLSQLGVSDESETDSRRLAKLSADIDHIISGQNTQTALRPMVMLNKNRQEVIISQAAPHGVNFGKTVICFNGDNKKSDLRMKNISLA